MAFGLGFNKAKVLSAAERYVQQGKLQNAIAEYEKILKNDPKDLTVLNTVGDLYARLGDNDRACQAFKSVGDAYAQQGFTVKAIAMYKKLTKMKSSLEGVLKLAELYTQQGLFNDARQQYLQVAEEFLRTGELEQAVRIFQKTLEMDPENVAMKVRLAEVYVRLGKKNEAWQIFSSAAEQLRSRGQVGPAEDILQRMLSLDPNNNQALLMRGRNALEAGDYAAAIIYLQKVPDLDSQPDVMKSLFQAYLAADRLSDAGVLANKLLTVHNDIEGISVFVDALMKGGLYQDALNIYQQHADRLMSADQGKMLENLHTIIGHVRSEPESLEVLLDLFQKAGESTHISEVIELLAHASVQKGDLERARGLYQQLATMEPQNPIHTQNYQQVSAKLGDAPRSETITAEEGSVIVDELEATAPSIEQDYPDEVAASVRAALTDSELFISYNMPAKALGPLMAVLPEAPRDVRLNQRLAALHTRAGRFTEAAICCRTLERVYFEYGYADESGRYGELAGRYEQRSGSAAAATTAAWSAGTSSHEPQHAPVEPASSQEQTAHLAELNAEEPTIVKSDDTIDISQEWEGTLSEEEPTPEPAGFAVAASDQVEPEPEPETQPAAEAAPANDDLVPETVEEIRFYLQHSMRLQALAAMAKLEAISEDENLISTLRSEYEAAFAPAPISERAAPPAAPADSREFQIHTEAAPHHEFDEVGAAAGPAHGELDEIVADLDSSLGAGFDHPLVPPSIPEPKPVREAAVAAAQKTSHNLGEFVSDLESALGDDFLPSAASPEPAPRIAASAAVAPLPVAAPAPVVKQAPAPTFAPAPVPAVAAPAASAAAASASSSTQQPLSSSLLATGVAQAASARTTDLSQMFSELKGELEEDATTSSTDEDPETHYNLGVAFREMGLLDEAIGELQKVCQIVERGHPFPQVMQTYTWLAQCFLDKGVPQAAIRWYERALKIPAIDADTRTALHYELATAHETAQNRDAALNHFMEVYGNNIDYRDVAERIKALKS